VRQDPHIESSTLGGGKASVGHKQEGYRRVCQRCGAVRTDQQIGLEETPDVYVDRLVKVFREVWRVLRNDGTVWLNLGDSYAAGGLGHGSGKQTTNYGSCNGSHIEKPRKAPNGLKPKYLIGIPWRVAFALQADGWYLRSDIIWCKKSPMPESVTDRPTNATEHIFLLAKSEKYYYDREAVRVPRATHENRTGWKRSYSFARKVNECPPPGQPNQHREDRADIAYNNGRNLWNYWLLGPEPLKLKHYAAFPTKIPEIAILAGSSPKACPKCGAPWKRVIEPTDEYRKHLGKGYHDHSHDSTQGNSQSKSMPNVKETYITVGWSPTCSCPGNDGSGKCIILDPFSGSGTTVMVALRHGRRGIGLELNPEYVEMSKKRIIDDAPLFNGYLQEREG
jgi:DNA modification methylase